MASRRQIVSSVLHDLGFTSPHEALKEITLLSAATQLAQYEEECARFERKYAVPFERFERQLRRQREHEDFSAEDDLMAWRFARYGVEHWRPRVEGLPSSAVSVAQGVALGSWIAAPSGLIPHGFKS